MVGFIFPGQGSQYAGMGKELVALFPAARRVFEEADDALGMALSRLCFEGPEEDLKLTYNTQPAILTTSIAALQVLRQETDLVPTYVAGHSLGEYSALVCAGSMTFADAVRTVRLRGTFMQEAVPVGVGAMAAVMGLGRDELASVCDEAAQGEVVSPANFNSPGQIVIAGHAGAVQRAADLAKSRGAKRALLLPVSAPFHCALMQPAGDRLKTVLDTLDIASPNVPVVTNVEAAANREGARIKDLLVAQVSAPVRWEESVEAMTAAGVSRFIEVGPGKVLSGLVKRIAKEAETAHIEDPKSLAEL